MKNGPDQSAEDRDGYDHAAPVESARLFVLTTRQQNREDDQDRDRADINEHLNETDELSAEKEVERRQSDEREHKTERSVNQFPQTSGRECAAECEDRDDDESRGAHSANR